jgi:hypothetical protein
MSFTIFICVANHFNSLINITLFILKINAKPNTYLPEAGLYGAERTPKIVASPHHNMCVGNLAYLVFACLLQTQMC